MNQPPPTEKQTGKRIVSKGEYAANACRKTGTSLFGLILLFLCLIGVVTTVLLLSTPLGALIGLLIGGMSLYLGYRGARIIGEATEIDPVILLTRANTADLPAPDSLVRASEEPIQEPQAVLLRAATESVERHEEQLVRASVGGTE